MTALHLTIPRRRVLVGVAAVALAGAASVGFAGAAAAENIDTFQTDVTVNSDTTFTVVETIKYDFGFADRHGIFRMIPEYEDVVTNGQVTGDRRVYDITVNSVTLDGQTVQYESGDDGPFLQVKIGDPDFTITGAHTYVINYTVANGLNVVTPDEVKHGGVPTGVAAGDVTLNWDLIGDQWKVPIGSAAAAVAGPGDILAAACYTGAQGSTATCPVSVSGHSASFGPVTLSAYEGMTGVTAFPAGAFSRVPTVDIQKAPPAWWTGLLGALLPALLLVILPIGYALSKRRSDAGVVMDGAPPQYSPPDDLTPAAMFTAWKGDVSAARSRTMVATLVDLAARRWINLSSQGNDLTVTWVGTGTKPLLPWEESLLAALLGGQPSATLSGYNENLATTWSAASAGLAADAETSGRRNPRGDAPDQRWWWLIFVLLGAVGLAFVFGFLHLGFLVAGAVLVAIAALVSFVACRIITPRQETQQSAQFGAKVRGFEKVLGTDAASSRREFAQRLNLPPEAVFATMLPYAIVFELEHSWMGAFPDLTPEQLAPYGFFYAGYGLGSLIDSGTSSVASAMTAPSSSSGSGFSSGGGFSGGGGGGGGGGSW